MWTVKHCFVKSRFIYSNKIEMWAPEWKIPQQLHESFSQFMTGYAVYIILFLNMWSLWNMIDKINQVRLTLLSTSVCITREIHAFSFSI